MDDRKLLEAAAKATGVDLEWDGPPDLWQPMYYEGKTYHGWNPLTDNGDALRLAVRRRMTVRVEDYGAAARIGDDGARWWRCEAHLHGGIEAATRRAIVHAAAAPAAKGP